MRRAVFRSATALGAALVVLFLPACSTLNSSDDPTPAAPTASSSTRGPTDLMISYRAAPEARAETWTLTCRPTGGSLPDPERACAALAENGEAMAPTPKDKMCTQVFGGTEVATVSGTWGGIAYAGRFSRENGCEVSRWDALVGLLPVGGTR